MKGMLSFIRKYTFEQRLAFFVFILAFFAAIIGNPMQAENVTLIDSIAGKKIDFISVRNVAELIMSRGTDFSIIDLREEKKFRQYHIPGAKSINKINLIDSSIFSSSNTLIIYGNKQTHVAEKWLELKEANLKNVLVLKGGIKGWVNEVLFPDLTDQPNLNVESTRSIKKMSLYFGGRPKFNTTGKNSLSRKYNREGC